MNSKDKIIKDLENQIESLQEENDSLWFLLEELQNSDITLFEQHISKALSDLRNRTLMTLTKSAEG